MMKVMLLQFQAVLSTSFQIQALYKSWKHNTKFQVFSRISSTCENPAVNWSLLWNEPRRPRDAKHWRDDNDLWGELYPAYYTATYLQNDDHNGPPLEPVTIATVCYKEITDRRMPQLTNQNVELHRAVLYSCEKTVREQQWRLTVLIPDLHHLLKLGQFK